MENSPSQNLQPVTYLEWLYKSSWTTFIEQREREANAIRSGLFLIIGEILPKREFKTPKIPKLNDLGGFH